MQAGEKMREELAEKILGEVMGWSPEDLSRERLKIQLMADIKYDNYQQYSQGKRYVESLAMWLNMLDVSDRLPAYQFINDNLLFVSSTEMRELVDVSYSSNIKPVLLEQTKQHCISNDITDLPMRKQIFTCFQRSSLFLGLSDGAHIDVFRRDHPFLSNEQIHVHYDLSAKKMTDIVKEIKRDPIINNQSIIKIDGITNIFLLDDFSASGISFIRKETENNVDVWKGKIVKFINQLIEYNVYCNNMKINVILYISTKKAIDRINNELKQYSLTNSMNIIINASAIQYVDSFICPPDINAIFNKYFSRYDFSKIVDKHYRKGDVSKPYLGFDGCSLPLVLYHNTPNNSFPILWFDYRFYSSEKEFVGLFPRVTRHKEDH